MKNKASVINIVPKKSIFEDEIRESSLLNNHDFFSYDWNASKNKRIVSFFRLMHLFFSDKYLAYCFHWVPTNWLFILSLIFKRNTVLYFWGSDFYGSVISAKEIEAHCVRKTPRLIEFQSSFNIPYRRSIFRKLKAMMTCYLAGHSAGVVGTEKNYRYMRYCYWKYFRKLGFPDRLDLKMYGSEDIQPSELLVDNCLDNSKNSVNILVCHNASSDLNVRHTARLLKELSEAFDINVYGFLSYSGGSEADRDQIESEYVELFSPFCKSVYFERKFLDFQKLDSALKNIHVAVFSCYRDEGICLLRRFLMMGGIVSFNKFSVNYGHFRQLSASKLLSHDELLDMDEKKILQLRQAKVECDFSKPEFSVEMLKGKIKHGI